MYKDYALLTYYTLTPLHMGAGTSVSYIDLPIQRERHTNFPIMAGSGIKGVFRKFARRRWQDEALVNKIFGGEEGSEGASLIAFTDAKILLYPLRSVMGAFAWITCPLVLKRFKEELQSIGRNLEIEIPALEDEAEKLKIIVSENSKLIFEGNKVALEEFVFEVENNRYSLGNIEKIKECIPNTLVSPSLSERFAIVSDNVFTDMVNYAVEVRTRIQIDQTTGTVKTGALFTLELIPSEAIFYSLVFVSDRDDINAKEELKELFSGNSNSHSGTGSATNNEIVLQFGGDETIGFGFVKVKFNEG